MGEFHNLSLFQLRRLQVKRVVSCKIDNTFSSIENRSATDIKIYTKKAYMSDYGKLEQKYD